MAAAPAIPSIEELLANIPGLRKGGDGKSAPAAAPAAAAAGGGDAPAGKRPRKGKAGDSAAPVAAAAAAPPPVHSLNVPEVTATLECPAGCVGNVIGKGGYTIKSIQAMSGASVQVAKEAVGGTARVITITGAPPCVAAAQAMVAQAIAQAQQQPKARAGPGPAAAAEGPRVELRLPCPADRIGWVIGPGGATVKAIRVLSGAQIDMLEEVTETGGRRGLVVLSGTADAVGEAKTAVGGLLGAAHAAASKAYAAQLAEAAEARRKWDEEQRRAQAPPAAAEGADAGAAPDAAAAAAAQAAAAQAEWKEMTATHPDGTTLRYWRHIATGLCRW